jgi:hypothetical protein
MREEDGAVPGTRERQPRYGWKKSCSASANQGGDCPHGRRFHGVGRLELTGAHASQVAVAAGSIVEGHDATSVRASRYFFKLPKNNSATALSPDPCLVRSEPGVYGAPRVFPGPEDASICPPNPGDSTRAGCGLGLAARQAGRRTSRPMVTSIDSQPGARLAIWLPRAPRSQRRFPFAAAGILCIRSTGAAHPNGSGRGRALNRMRTPDPR